MPPDTLLQSRPLPLVKLVHAIFFYVLKVIEARAEALASVNLVYYDCLTISAPTPV
jgi:hypothetical protein